MPDTIATLRVKDATGSNITLSAVSGTNGIATYHALTGTIASDISSSLNYNGASAAYWLNTIHSKVETVQGYLTYGGSSAATLINTANSRLETTNNKLTDVSSSLNYGGYSTAYYLNEIKTAVQNLDTNDLPDVRSSLDVIENLSIVDATSSNYNLGSGAPLDAAGLVDGMTHTLSFIPFNSNTKGVMFYNHTDADVYVRINGIPTASSGHYSFVIPPSGSKDILDPRYCKFSFYFTGSTNTTGYFNYGFFT